MKHPLPDPPHKGEGSIVIEGPLFRVDIVAQLLAGLDVGIESPPRPWSGDCVIGLLVWQGVTESDMNRLPNLRAIGTASIGVDHIDLEAARRRGIWVCNVPDYCVEEVADSTIAMLLALLRGVVALDRSVRDGQWDDHAAGPLPRLSDTRLGIIGFGRIGRAVGKRAKALGVETWASDPLVSAEDITGAGVRPASLDELLAHCTAVTLHLPLTPETDGLMGANELAQMRPGSYLINAARGQLVDLDALIAALDRGHLAGAAIDVLSVEPPPASRPVPRHPKLIVTPHAAWYSPTSEREVIRRSTLALRAIVEGRQPEGLVVRGKDCS